MDYKKHYDLLIERSQNRVLEGYTERHHIIPKCLNGSDDVSNIAILSPEEHFLAHLLLVKIYPNCQPLVNAAIIMTTHHTTQRANNKLFGWLRRRASEAMKQRIKENGHPRGFLGKKHTGDALEKVKSAQRSSAIAKRVKIYAYNMDGTFYKDYDSINECADDLQTSPSNVKYTADGEFKHCRGKQLRYNYQEVIEKYIHPNSNKKLESICPHCSKIGSGPIMKRFHFDKCKHKRDKK